MRVTEIMKRAFILLAFATSLHAAPARVLSVVEPKAALGETLTLRTEGDLGDCKELVLFIQRSPIHGLPARCGKGGTVAFDLAVNDKNAERWHRILGGHFFKREVTVGLGPNDQLPFDSPVVDFPFQILKVWHVIVLTLVAIILFAALVLVRRFTAALDSLARLQIALWIVVITVSYVYIWSITGETEIINPTALALLAIGGGTALGASIIKGSRAVDVKTVAQALANAPAEDFTPIEIAGPTGLHALMVATWTAVLAVIFAATVFRQLELPDFSGNVLTLLGICGGTYLAFSLPQQH